MDNLSYLNHLKVFFGNPTLRTDKIFRDVLPLGARCEAFILTTLGLIVNPTTYDALPFPHELLPGVLKARCKLPCASHINQSTKARPKTHDTSAKI